jgi:hypothetical protein
MVRQQRSRSHQELAVDDFVSRVRSVLALQIARVLRGPPATYFLCGHAHGVLGSAGKKQGLTSHDAAVAVSPRHRTIIAEFNSLPSVHPSTRQAVQLICLP